LGINDLDYHAAKRELRKLEQEFHQFVAESKSKGTPIALQLNDSTQLIFDTLEQTGEGASLIVDLALIKKFLEPLLSTWDINRGPLRLTDLILKRAADCADYNKGSCVPASALAARLAQRSGLILSAITSMLFEDGHIFLVHPESTLTLDVLNPLDPFNNIQNLREKLSVGANQGIEDCTSFVSYHFDNCNFRHLKITGKGRLKAALKISPKSYIFRIRQAESEPDPQTSLSMVKDLMKIHPHDFNLYVIAGKREGRLGRHELAEENFKRALLLLDHLRSQIDFDSHPELENDFIFWEQSVRLLLTAALINKGQKAEAVAELSRIKPCDYQQKEFKGLLCINLMMPSEAAALFEEVLKEARDDKKTQGRAHVRLGWTYLWLGRHEEALMQWDLAINLEPSMAHDVMKMLDILRAKQNEAHHDLIQLAENRFRGKLPPR
jgi:hypothetical protein